MAVQDGLQESQRSYIGTIAIRVGDMNLEPVAGFPGMLAGGRLKQACPQDRAGQLGATDKLEDFFGLQEGRPKDLKWQ